MYKNKYLEECFKNKKGNTYILKGYKCAKYFDLNALIISDLGFIGDNKSKLKNFKEELIKANIKEFILAESSSSLMANLHALDSVGIRIKGCTTIRHNQLDEIRYKEGLKMIVE